jgi:hypothetical protein
MVAAATGREDPAQGLHQIGSQGTRKPFEEIEFGSQETTNFYRSAVTQPQTKPDFQSTKTGKERC